MTKIGSFKEEKLTIIDNNNSLSYELEDNSTLNLLYFSRIQEDNKLEVVVGNDSTLKMDLILMNQNSNIDINVVIKGKNSNVLIRTLSLALEATKLMNINVIHENEYSKSEVINNGIAFKGGNITFNVYGTIKKDMRGSDARQISKGLILDDTAKIKVLPVLLIDNYDVKAYHGATIGKINDDDMFYLMSRGLNKQEAFMVVINGILEPFISSIEDEKIKKEIINKYLSYFGD